MLPIKFGFLESKYFPGEEDPKEALCSDSKCHKLIEEGDVVYLDINNNSMYCDSCGKCIRYARKKAYQRGELDLQGRSITE